MNICRVTVTPTLAAEFLSKNVERNRPIKKDIVMMYANDMSGGRWQSDNGETIKFDTNGFLIDGQHRLSAVLRSGVSIAMWVVTDIDHISIKTIDTGAARTVGNIMHMDGEIDANKKAALVRNLLKLKTHSCKFPLARPTASEQIEFYEANRDLIDRCYKIADHLARKSQVKIQASIIGSFLAMFDQSSIEEFFNQVCTGRNIEMNVIHLLRDRLIRNLSAVAPLPKSSVEELILKAYVYFKEGRDVSVLKSDQDVKQLFIRAIAK
jgi:ribosomal 50S subunit-associated protein YjgA (DUF615 family)